MKTSKLKPALSLEQARDILPIAEDIASESFKQLTEGHFSQAFSFETTTGDKRVLRLGRMLFSFQADQFAHDRFVSADLPIPAVLQIGNIEPGLYYCVSELAPGVPSDHLSSEDFVAARESMERVYAAIFKTDIARSNGSGNVDLTTGNAKSTNFQVALHEEMLERDPKFLKEQCAKYNINPILIDEFMRQFDDNIDQAAAERRLIHGDLGSDNVLISDGRVTGVIDWSSVGYGDWLHDYSRMEFWYPGKNISATEFAHKYELETQNFEARWLAGMAAHAISTLDFAFHHESDSVTQWLREHLQHKLGLSGVK